MLAAMDLVALVNANEQRWNAGKITRGTEFAAVAAELVATESKTKFQALEHLTGVPWFVIAVIKQRESGIDRGFYRNIANGQPWNLKTTIVPIGRGPFASWFDAGNDALVSCAPYAARWRDWSAGGLLTLLEQYNGLGYALKGKPSPYVWSGTDQYVSGKYVRDHVFDPSVVDAQLGCAGLLIAMCQLDSSITIGHPGAAMVRLAPNKATNVTPTTHLMPPRAKTISGGLAGFISSLF